MLLLAKHLAMIVHLSLFVFVPSLLTPSACIVRLMLASPSFLIKALDAFCAGPTRPMYFITNSKLASTLCCVSILTELC